MQRRRVLDIAALVVAAATTVHANDVGVLGRSAKISVNTVTGKQTLKSVQKDPLIHFGPVSTPAQLSGSIEVYYVDAPTNKSVLSMPSPWLSNSGIVAKYKNAAAPLGPTLVKTASVKNGKVAKVTAKGAGPISIASPPGVGGIVTVLTIVNAADASTHRMCTRYAAASGSTITHKVLSSGFKLTLKNGVATPCPSCVDGAQNGNETGVDCGGGACPACAPGNPCILATDCTSGVCTAGICQSPDCSDGIQNGTESDVDCGGGACPQCGPGSACNAFTDCTSGVCTLNVCQGPTCFDSVANGTETGIDCGGGICPTCTAGEGCDSGTDCQSGVCSGNVCQNPSCTDGVENGSETDVDCGGGVCGGCGTGDACVVASDCLSLVCTGNVCQAPSCTDGIFNGNETGLDCGGGTCPTCSNGQPCNVNNDCTSNYCNNLGVCTNPTCTDGVKNGLETDVDCGGPVCPDCALGQMCLGNGDCLSTRCSGFICKCGNQAFTFVVNSNDGGSGDSAEWPGGTATLNGATGCSVTINRPSDNIDLVCSLSNRFSVNTFAGYSNCFGTGGEDGDGCSVPSCPPAGIGSCCTGRPSCSAALNGSGQARYDVQCNE